jgi:hypothetical protein
MVFTKKNLPPLCRHCPQCERRRSLKDFLLSKDLQIRDIHSCARRRYLSEEHVSCFCDNEGSTSPTQRLSMFPLLSVFYSFQIS